MAHDIPDVDWSYAHQEWGRGLSFYQSRLRRLGFDKRPGWFLDAGCGTGQWMDALASIGKDVVGVDVRISRLEIASIFLNPRRTHLVRASVDLLPFREDIFSNIICYGVLMFTDAEKVLWEFRRVSQNGSCLYVCWNGLGWSLSLLMRDHRPRLKRQAVETVLNTWLGRKGTRYFSMKRMLSLLTRAGLTVLASDGEGQISGSPIYSKTFLAIENVLEAIAVCVK